MSFCDPCRNCTRGYRVSSHYCSLLFRKLMVVAILTITTTFDPRQATSLKMSSTSTPSSRLHVHAVVAVVTAFTALLLAAAEEEEEQQTNNNNSRFLSTTNRLKRKRGKRRVFDSHGAYKCLKRDFLSPYVSLLRIPN
jgi:hypothetical protein